MPRIARVPLTARASRAVRRPLVPITCLAPLARPTHAADVYGADLVAPSRLSRVALTVLVSCAVACTVPSTADASVRPTRAPAASLARPSTCAAGETALVVRTSAHELTLCEDGTPVRTFDVSLGWGGVGKRRMGDGKTPLGRYPLARPRASHLFGTFIGVGYPTSAQIRLGFTGTAVGIHGPPRHAPAFLASAADWTAGCIAVATDDEITAIARWIRTRDVKLVRLE